MHLKQAGFTYSACGAFTKNKERIQKFKEAGDTKYIYRNVMMMMMMMMMMMVGWRSPCHS